MIKLNRIIVEPCFPGTLITLINWKLQATVIRQMQLLVKNCDQYFIKQCEHAKTEIN
jgi:hypothetical protein